MSPTRIRQSDLEAWTRCPQQKHLYDLAGAGLLANQATGELVDVPRLSATVFGTVVHHALQTLERLHHEGRPDALEVAVATFEHYWDPAHIDELEPGGVTQWLPRQSYGGLRTRGRNNLRYYYDVLKADDGMLLALEHQFFVPIGLTMPDGEVQQHELSGTVDRLALRTYMRKPFVSVDDFKSGKKDTYLRYKVQWTVYAYASLHPEFWSAWTPEMLEPIVAPLHKRKWRLFDGDRCADCGKHDPTDWVVIPRRGRWISIRDTFGVHDTGWRLPNDYGRLEVALAEYVRSIEAEIYPLSISGSACTYCPFNNGICGRGIPLADEKEMPQW